LRHGQGTRYYGDGSIFQGQFQYGKSDGAGVLKRLNGDQVVGDFYSGHPDGKVIILMAGNKDRRIEGQFRHGMAHGRVRLYTGQKMMYEGNFRYISQFFYPCCHSLVKRGSTFCFVVLVLNKARNPDFVVSAHGRTFSSIGQYWIQSGHVPMKHPV
jgi:hypothetical protein